MNVVFRIVMRKDRDCRVARLWAGPQEEDDLLDNFMGLRSGSLSCRCFSLDS